MSPERLRPVVDDVSMMRAGVISDELWAVIEPVLPSDVGRRGKRWADHRRIMEGIVWRIRSGRRGGTCPAASARGRRCGSGTTGGPPMAPTLGCSWPCRRRSGRRALPRTPWSGSSRLTRPASALTGAPRRPQGRPDRYQHHRGRRRDTQFRGLSRTITRWAGPAAGGPRRSCSGRPPDAAGGVDPWSRSCRGRSATGSATRRLPRRARQPAVARAR